VAKKRQVRLDLRRAAPPPPEDDLAGRQRSSFWKWFTIVAIFHLLVLTGVYLFYWPAAKPPPTQFMSLVPLGDTVKGTPGQQSAPKVGATTPAPAAHHHHQAPPAPTPPQPVTPPPPPRTAVQPPPVPPKPVIHEENAPALATSKPKPPAPKKIKVDLHLAAGPAPVAKPKHAKKKPAPVADDRQNEPERDASNPENMGLSKEQIAARLGQKLEAAGVTHSDKFGTSGAADGHANPFADFYASIHDQVMNKWEEPNQDDAQATDPVVQIHVEKNGRVPPEQVSLLRGSGNQAIDDSALSAARSLGYTLQPLPDGCPPDISITFKLNH
jgi:TonB family protein